MKSIPFYTDLLKQGTMSEVALYGLICVMSKKSGECWASSQTLGEILGLNNKTVRNVLCSISKKGWIEVKPFGNRRAVKPLI